MSVLAAAINDAARLTGSFMLRSGTTSTEYFDKYRFEARPDLLAQVAAELALLVPDDTEVLAGLELGGIPIATALSGRRVLVVEDVVSTAGQIVSSTRDLRSLGAEITTAVCVIDRESGGWSALGEIDVDLRSLFTRSDLG